MTTMQDLVTETINRLDGGSPGTLTRLNQDYVSGDDALDVSPGVPGVNPGQILSVGLNTFYVLTVNPLGTEIGVMQIGQYGNVAMPAETVVRVRPSITTADVFDRLRTEIAGMSSPMNGLFAVRSEDFPMDWVDGTYSMSSTTLDSAMAVLAVRYQETGRDVWHEVNGWEWQADTGVVKVIRPVSAAGIRIIAALPFSSPSDLNSDLGDIGLAESMRDIPVLGALSHYALSLEARRTKPTSQGDPRRASEVPMTAGTSLSREYARQRAMRVTEEAARLARLYGYRMQDLGQVCRVY